MSIMLDKLFLYFQYPFVVNALIVGVLIALCSSMLGVTLVLKRYSFIGDGLSHVAFGAMAVAAVAGFTDDMPFILLVTVAFAVLLLRTGQNAKIKGDAVIAMISVGALAVGYLLMNVFSSSANVSGFVKCHCKNFVVEHQEHADYQHAHDNADKHVPFCQSQD